MTYTNTLSFFKNVYCIIVFFLITTIVLQAQVVIKDSISITPKRISKFISTNSSSSDGVIKFRFYWTPINNSSSTLFHIYEYCGMNMVGGSGDVYAPVRNGECIVTFPLTGGLLSYEVWTFWMDNVAVEITNGDFPPDTISISRGQPKWVGSYSNTGFFFDDPGPSVILFRRSVPLSLSTLSGCKDLIRFFPATDPVTFTIEQGSEYACLADPETGVSYGSTFVGLLSDAPAVVDKFTATREEVVVVSASILGYRVEKTFLIENTLDHFDVQVDPSEIEYGATSIVHAIAKDLDGLEINASMIPEDRPVIITASPEGYGHFESPIQAGRTVSGVGSKENSVELLPVENDNTPAFGLTNNDSLSKNKAVALREKYSTNKIIKANSSITGEIHTTTSEPFECIYWEVLNGLVFVADGIEPDSNVTITFTVTAVEKPTAIRTGSLVIKKEQSLCPVVSIEPATIKAGETANIIVKGKKDDGETIVDYPAGTQFTFTITSGAEFGTVIGNTSPAQFIANENIVAENAVVTIYAAVAGGGAMAKKKQGVQTKNASGCVEPMASVIIGCNIEGFSCSTIPFQFNITPFTSFERDIVECGEGLGVTFYDPHGEKTFVTRESFDPSTCYDPSKKVWVLQGGTMTTKIRASICYNVATNKHLKNINSINDINNTNYDCALKTFKAALRSIPLGYFPATAGYVWSSKGTEIHEKFHIDKFEKAITAAYYGGPGMPNIEQMLKEVTIPKCDAKTNAEAKEKMVEQINKVFTKYEKNIEIYHDIYDTEQNACAAVKGFYEKLAEKIALKATKNKWTNTNLCTGF